MPAMSRARILPLPLLAAALLSACGGESSPADQSAAASGSVSPPNVIEITGGDYFFEAPDTIPAGATTFRFSAGGEELHHVQIVKLPEGKTLADIAAESKGGEPPSWAVMIGGPNAPIPGVSTSVTSVELTPGNYALLCLIPSPDGKLHVEKGMSRPLVVVPSDTPRALPEAHFTVRLTDYAFTMPDSIGAGPHVLRVENDAEQPHEIVFIKLDAGKSPEDVASWVERMDGPPPGAPFGGTSAIAKGGVNVVSIDLPPGDYGLLCFIPDWKDGKPHVAHGMLRRLKVG